MSKHTPGPWVNSNGTVHKKSGGWVANCDGHNGSGCEQCNANANLIAAAPEMYEALIRLNMATIISPDPESPYMQARMALNKAEGKS